MALQVQSRYRKIFGRIELSCFVLTDGLDYKILPTAKDYKRIGEGDTGLNTGGMGAISPVPFADENIIIKIEERIVKPTVEGLKKSYHTRVYLYWTNCGQQRTISYRI